MFERFTDRARRALVLAQEEARRLNHDFIGTEHILLGLIQEGDGVAAKALVSLGISLEAVREKLEDTIGPPGSPPSGSVPFTPRAKKVLELSLREALQLGHNYIGTEHVLLGLVREGEGVAAQVLIGLGADLSRVRQTVIELLSGVGASKEVRSTASKLSRRGWWPRHPTKVIAGPDERLVSDGIEFRVVGVLLFAEGTRVLWRMSGIPKPIADALQGVQAGEVSVAFVTLSDDGDGAYDAADVALELQPGDEWAGSSLFVPPLPDGTSHVTVGWQGATLRIEV